MNHFASQGFIVDLSSTVDKGISNAITEKNGKSRVGKIFAEVKLANGSIPKEIANRKSTAEDEKSIFHDLDAPPDENSIFKDAADYPSVKDTLKEQLQLAKAQEFKFNANKSAFEFEFSGTDPLWYLKPENNQLLQFLTKHSPPNSKTFWVEVEGPQKFKVFCDKDTFENTMSKLVTTQRKKEETFFLKLTRLLPSGLACKVVKGYDTNGTRVYYFEPALVLAPIKEKLLKLNLDINFNPISAIYIPMYSQQLDMLIREEEKRLARPSSTGIFSLHEIKDPEILKIHFGTFTDPINIDLNEVKTLGDLQQFFSRKFVTVDPQPTPDNILIMVNGENGVAKFGKEKLLKDFATGPDKKLNGEIFKCFLRYDNLPPAPSGPTAGR